MDKAITVKNPVNSVCHSQSKLLVSQQFSIRNNVWETLSAKRPQKDVGVCEPIDALDNTQLISKYNFNIKSMTVLLGKRKCQRKIVKYCFSYHFKKN